MLLERNNIHPKESIKLDPFLSNLYCWRQPKVRNRKGWKITDGVVNTSLAAHPSHVNIKTDGLIHSLSKPAMTL